MPIEKGLINIVQNQPTKSGIIRKVFNYANTASRTLFDSFSSTHRYNNEKTFFNALAVHPNTPMDILKQLTGITKDGRSTNPILIGNANFSDHAWERIISGLV